MVKSISGQWETEMAELGLPVGSAPYTVDPPGIVMVGVVGVIMVVGGAIVLVVGVGITGVLLVEKMDKISFALSFDWRN